MSIQVQGAEQLARLSKALKEAGRKDLQRELSRGISKAARPFVKAVRQSARDKLPNHGGLAARVAKTQIRTIRRVGTTTAGIRMQTRGGRKSAASLAEKGTINHPVYGNREVWVNGQRIPSAAGWWTEPGEAMLPQVRRDIIKAMEEVAAKIDRAV